MIFVARLVALFGLAVALSSCCSLARLVCDIEAPPDPSPHTRDTPQEAVDFLIEAFEESRISAIYESLHGDFIERWGAFSASDFAVAFEEYEHLFEEDARSLRASNRSEIHLDDNGDAYIRLQSGDTMAVLVFRNEPAYRVLTDDDDIGGTSGRLGSLEGSLATEGGDLSITRALPLNELVGLPANRIKRLEFHRDWLLYRVSDYEGIRFLERLEEER